MSKRVVLNDEQVSGVAGGYFGRTDADGDNRGTIWVFHTIHNGQTIVNDTDPLYYNDYDEVRKFISDNMATMSDLEIFSAMESAGIISTDMNHWGPKEGY